MERGLIDEIDILMRRNPDWDREEAIEYYNERKGIVETDVQSPFLNALKSNPKGE